MTVVEAKRLPNPSDFFACPIWRYDEDDDLYHPVLREDEIPESERDLSIRAVFTTPSGIALDGYVVGISRVFSISLFGKDELFHANHNLKSESREWMSQFISNRPDLNLNSPDELFPLRYMTQIDRDGYREFSGTFDIS